MKLAATTTALVLTLAMAAGGATALNVDLLPDKTATNVMLSQEGSNSGCLDFLVLWAVDGVHSPVGDDEKVEVSAGTGWEATSEDGSVWVDFYNADGVWIGGDADSGSVPAGAAYGYGCVVLLGGFPDVPVPGASFTYADGL